jgi:hypothetical protein
MTDVDYEHDQALILYLVDDSVVSYPDSVEVIGSAKFLRMGRMRRDGQTTDGRVYTT